MNINEPSTIAAIATPFGTGGIGIIRISGPLTLKTVQAIFRTKSATATGFPELEHRKIYVGFIIDPVHLTFIDEAVLFVMRSPRSYTCEDVAEIQLHGSAVVLHTILEIILSLGVSLAEPGEFTKRAFLNGRIDLIQAESIIDLLQAKTRISASLSSSLLKGGLGLTLERIKRELLELLSLINASIDFPDEEIPVPPAGSLIERMEAIIETDLNALINSYHANRYLKEGVKIGIAGPPNVGKSSLLNCLIQKERSIVTPIPGTTRDIVEDSFMLNGIPMVISDTAGLHETQDPVEIIGIARARSHLKETDVILLVFDASKEIGSMETQIHDDLCQNNIILVFNKMDLMVPHHPPDTRSFNHILDTVFISAKHGQGISTLKEAILRAVHPESTESIHPIVPNLRQQTGLRFIEERLLEAKNNLMQIHPIELIAIDLQAALDKIDEITGENTPVDIFDMIFNQFCIGK